MKLTTGLGYRPSRCCYAPQHIYITGLSSALSARIPRSGMDCEKRTVTFSRTSLFPAYLWDTAGARKYSGEKQTLGACAVVAGAKRLCFSRVAPVPADSLGPVRVLLPNKRTTLTWTCPVCSDNGPAAHFTAGGPSVNKNNNNSYMHGYLPPSAYLLLQRRCSNNKESHRGEPEVSSWNGMIPSMVLPGCLKSQQIATTFLSF